MSLTEAANRFSVWRDDPRIFVRECLGITPDKWQDEFLEAFPKTPRLALSACKGPGKTACLSWIAWNFLLTRPYPKIAATSITGSNLADNFWTEMAKTQQKSKLLMEAFTYTKTRIFLKQSPETWWISARPWSKAADKSEQGNTLAGLHADYILFLIDESGDIPESVSMAAEAALTSCVEGHIVQAGNPSSLTGMLYKACVRDRHLWHVIKITSDPDDPKRTPRVSIEWARQQIETYGRDNPYIKVNVLGEFPSAAFNSLIGIDEVEASTKRHYRESDYSAHARILGGDVAREGLDKSVIFPRQGLQAFNPIIYRNIDGTQGANHVARKWVEWDADACFIDDTGGFGSSWIDNLARLGFAPIGIHFNEKPQDKRYFNKRSEMIFEMVQWIKRGGAIPYSPELMQALAETTYTHKGDALIIEPKMLIKERLGYSPDEMDALCFVENTMIETPNGKCAIQSLEIGDLVCTPFGDTRIAKTWVSRTDKLTTVRFSNGSELCGKGEHKIFVWGAGQSRLDTLSLTNEVVTTGQWSILWRLSTWIIKGKDIQFKPLVDIIRVERSVTARAFFTATFGLIISEKFQKVLSFITRIMTGVTTPQETFALCEVGNIPATTWKNFFQTQLTKMPIKNTWIPLEAWHLNGTLHRKELSGIKNMGEKCGLAERLKRNNANAVIAITKPIWAILNIVLALVGRKSDIEDISPKKENVLGAIRNLWPIVTGRQSVVPVSVQTGIAGKTSVYNLTLERHNAYYANGILVYNCLTFAQPVMRQARGPVNRGAGVRTDYNPLSMGYVKKMLGERR